MYKKQRTMKIYKYKVAMMVAAAWFIATALFCTIPSVWQAVVATVLALVPLPLMRYEKVFLDNLATGSDSVSVRPPATQWMCPGCADIHGHPGCSGDHGQYRHSRKLLPTGQRATLLVGRFRSHVCRHSGRLGHIPSHVALAGRRVGLCFF